MPTATLSPPLAAPDPRDAVVVPVVPVPVVVPPVMVPPVVVPVVVPVARPVVVPSGSSGDGFGRLSSPVAGIVYEPYVVLTLNSLR